MFTPCGFQTVKDIRIKFKQKENPDNKEFVV